MKKALIGFLVPLTLTTFLAGFASASIRPTEEVRKEALEAISLPGCDSKLAALRVLGEIGSGNVDFEELALGVIEACACSEVRSRAILLLGAKRAEGARRELVRGLERYSSADDAMTRAAALYVLASADLIEASAVHAASAVWPPGSDELILGCGALGELGTGSSQCARLAESVSAISVEMSFSPPDELLRAKAQVLGDQFPAAAIQAIPAILRSAGACAESCEDGVRLIQRQWRESAAAAALPPVLLEGRAPLAEKLQLIGFLRSSSPAALDLLRNALASGPADVRLQALSVCRDLGEHGSELAPDVEPFLKSKNLGLQRQAAFTLLEIEPAHARELIMKVHELDPELAAELMTRTLEKHLD